MKDPLHKTDPILYSVTIVCSSPAMQSSSHEHSIPFSGQKENTDGGTTKISVRNKGTFAQMAQKIINEAQKNKNVKKVRIRVRVRRMVKEGKGREKPPRKVLSGEMAAKLLKQRVIALKQRRARYTTSKQKSNVKLDSKPCIDLTKVAGNETLELQHDMNDSVNRTLTSDEPVPLPNYMVHPTTHTYCPITGSVESSVPNVQKPEAQHTYMEFDPPSFHYEPPQPITMEESQQHQSQEGQDESRTFSDHIMNIEEL